MSATFRAIFGIAAGFYGGVRDTLLMRFVDMLLAIPPIFFFIMPAIWFRPKPVGLSAVIAFISWVSVARLVRAEVLSTKHLDFILAARGLGATAGSGCMITTAQTYFTRAVWLAVFSGLAKFVTVLAFTLSGQRNS